jgi:hypothetical protein
VRPEGLELPVYWFAWEAECLTRRPLPIVGHFFDSLHRKRSVSLTHQRLHCHKRLGESLLAERDYRVNPRRPQRWDQACEYGNHR